jgi:hypothetical protein
MFPLFRQARRSLAQWSALLCAAWLFAVPIAHAGGHGGGGEGGGGPSPMTFVVNVGPTRSGGMVLQMSIVLEPATPEAAKLIDAYKPMIQHRVLIVAAGLSPDSLRKPETRNKLSEKLVEEINDDLGTTKKNGIKEIFYTSFIFQQM